jgi:hypothetical protein
MDHESIIRAMIANDDDYEDAVTKTLKTSRDTHKKYVDNIRKNMIKNEDD